MENQEEQETKPPPPEVKDSKKIPKWLIIALAIFLLAGIGTFASLKLLGKKNTQVVAEGENDPKKDETNGEIGPMFPLDPFIVNLADGDGKRYLKLTMELELEEEKTSEELEKRSAQIRDTVLTLLTSKTFVEIKDVAGKFKLREQITGRVNTHLKLGKIRQVYFTEFVIQ
jgi:flagellar FliL protein